MSLLQEPPPPPPSPHHEHETLIQYNLRNKVCAYCKRPGALLKCEGCRQRSYCDRKCQKRDWKQEHRGQCAKLQQVFVPPPHGWRGAAAEAGGGGGWGKAAAAAVDVDDDELENPCPICLDNEDDAAVDGKLAGMCTACGQSYCGACNTADLADRSPNCPTCRAPFTVSEEEHFTRYWKLIHDRSPGRHTPVAQCGLGNMYHNGSGAEQEHVEAVKWYRKAAEAGHAKAQCSLGCMYHDGEGVEQDHVEAVKWYRKAAEAGDAVAQCLLGAMYFNGKDGEQDFSKAVRWLQLAAAQGFKDALTALDLMQQQNYIPTPPSGTAVTTILLSSAKAAKYNARTGRVVEPTEGVAIKPGRAAVLLDGEAAPISFKLMNLRVHPTTAASPMSLPAEPPPPPPPSRHREHETLIQYNLRNKVCAYCKRPGARLKCEGCRQRSYCDRKCQKRDWKQEHRGQCVKLQQVFVPPPPGWRGSAGAEASGSGGSAAAAAGGGGAPTVVIDDDDEIENPCPICLDNEDDAIVDGAHYGMCYACGQSYCGACNTADRVGRLLNCPTCRAPLIVSDEKAFKRCWKLEHDRSPGRHTPVAQYNLGCLYETGNGVKQDHVEAAKWYRKAGKAAEAGYAMAQCNLGIMYRDGEGVEQDHVEAAKWYRKSAEAGNAVAQFNLGAAYYNGEGVEQDLTEALNWTQLAAVQGHEKALEGLDCMQQGNVIPTPPPSTTVTTILLTSANAAKYNNRTGRVVAPTKGAAIKPG
eukprot:gene32625-biopygen27452